MKKLKPMLGVLFAGVIILACAGIALIKIAFDQAENNVIKEHDNHLYDLAYSVDMNLYNGLNRIKDEMGYVISLEDFKNAEQHLEESNESRQRMMNLLQNSILSELDDIEYIMIYRGNQKILCSKCDDDCEMDFLPDSDGDDIGVCSDEDGTYYVTVQISSVYGDYSYYILLNLDDFYETIIADSIKKDNWIALYDEGSGLLLQNHKNQPSYLILTKKEIEKRGDGYTILNRYQERQEIGAETYTYANPDGSITPQRIVILPSSKTKNGIFAVGIAMNSASTYKNINEARQKTAYSLFLFACSAALLAGTIAYIWSERKRMEDNIANLKKENALKEELAQAQIKNAVSQMQPHFLYNALSSIREIVLEDPEYASDLIYDFTMHLRACIKAMASSDLIPFSKEMENIHAYMNIEKMRFGEKLHVVYNLQYEDFLIVPLSIQPLVENAIRHGICQRGRQGGTVTLTSLRTENSYVIRICDDGVGFNYEAVCEEVKSGKRDSTGLMNTCLRLKKMLHAEVNIQSTPGIGTDIEITIPFLEE